MMCAKSVSLLLLCLVLMTSTLVACGKTEAPLSTTATLADGDSVGQGAVAFALEIVTRDGETVRATVYTDEKTVGAALETLHLIAGEDGPYGLYIKEVNGWLADYEQTGTYWAFYEDGVYAVAGVDKTVINPAVTYALKEEKA